MPIDQPANFFFATVTATFTSTSLELELSTIVDLVAPGYLVLFNYSANKKGPPTGNPVTNGVEILRYDGINVGAKKVTLTGVGLRGLDGSNAITPTVGATYAVSQDAVAIYLAQIRDRLLDIDSTGKLAAWDINGDDTYKLGVGTAAPTRKLHAYAATGDFIIQAESGDAFAGVELVDTSGSYIVGTISTDLVCQDGATSNRTLRILGSAPADSLVIEASGNVGLGIANSLSSLHISRSGAGLRITDTVGSAENPHIHLEGSTAANLGLWDALEDSSVTRLYGRAGIALHLGSGNDPDVIHLLSGALSDSIRARSSGVMTLCPSSQAADGDLVNSSLHFSVNEGGNLLQIKVKYSDATVKTATIAVA